MFDPEHPYPQSFYYETLIRLYDLIHRVMAMNLDEIMPAGDYASICGTVIGGVHPDTGK